MTAIGFFSLQMAAFAVPAPSAQALGSPSIRDAAKALKAVEPKAKDVASSHPGLYW